MIKDVVNGRYVLIMNVNDEKGEKDEENVYVIVKNDKNLKKMVEIKIKIEGNMMKKDKEYYIEIKM
jgi:hypothetical protein